MLPGVLQETSAEGPAFIVCAGTVRFDTVRYDNRTGFWQAQESKRNTCENETGDVL